MPPRVAETCEEGTVCRMRTRRKRMARHIQRCRGQIDAVIVGNPHSLQRRRACAGIATRDTEEPERLNSLLDEDPMQAGTRFPVEEIVLLDHGVINLPLLLEHGLRPLVLPVCSSRGIADGAH